MGYLSCICFILFIRHSCDSYVLLTASVDDVHDIAHQVAKSPVVSQLRELWQQASQTFLQHYDLGNKRTKPHNRQKITTYNQNDEPRPLPDVRFPKGLAHAPVLRSMQSSVYSNNYQKPEDAAEQDLKPVKIQRRYESPPDLNSHQDEMTSQELMEQRRQAASALVDLGRNASLYLRSLQKILETM